MQCRHIIIALELISTPVIRRHIVYQGMRNDLDNASMKMRFEEQNETYRNFCQYHQVPLS